MDRGKAGGAHSELGTSSSLGVRLLGDFGVPNPYDDDDAGWANSLRAGEASADEDGWVGVGCDRRLKGKGNPPHTEQPRSAIHYITR